ncbi:MAG: 4'-phosphopantetheinyl transferase superfamily protein [Chromatiales bacterium]
MSEGSLADVICPVRWTTSAASAALPSDGQILLWYLEQSQIPLHAEWLAPDELARTVRMTPDRRDEFVSGRNALRLILGSFFSITPPEVVIRVSDKGKPHLENDAVEFSFSHCQRKLLMAFSGKPLGADLEALRSKPDLLRIARRLFDSRCCGQLEAAGDAQQRETLFYRFWSAHEAVQKLRGDGIFGERHLPPFVAGFELHGFRGAVASTIEAPEFLMHEELPVL